MSTKDQLEQLHEKINRVVVDAQKMREEQLRKDSLLNEYGSVFLLDGNTIDVYWFHGMDEKRYVACLDEDDLRKLLRAVKPWWKFW